MINQQTSLAIIGGDFNNTDEPEDRIRPNPETTDRFPDQDPTFLPLYVAGFVDSHAGGEMTCETETERGTSESRIDRIFYWTNFHAVATKTRVQRVSQLSNHKVVFTTITTSSLPESAPPRTKTPSLNTRNATTETKERYAKAIHKYFSGENKHLIPQIKNWAKDLRGSDEGIKEASLHIRKIAHKFFFTPPKSHTEENKTKLRIKTLDKIIRRVETLQLLGVDKFPKSKTQRKMERLVSRLPTYLKEIRARPNSVEGHQWVKALRQEKKTKLSKLRTDRKVRTNKETRNSQLNNMHFVC